MGKEKMEDVTSISIEWAMRYGKQLESAKRRVKNESNMSLLGGIMSSIYEKKRIKEKIWPAHLLFEKKHSETGEGNIFCDNG